MGWVIVPYDAASNFHNIQDRLEVWHHLHISHLTFCQCSWNKILLVDKIWFKAKTIIKRGTLWTNKQSKWRHRSSLLAEELSTIHASYFTFTYWKFSITMKTKLSLRCRIYCRLFLTHSYARWIWCRCRWAGVGVDGPSPDTSNTISYVDTFVISENFNFW